MSGAAKKDLGIAYHRAPSNPKTAKAQVAQQQTSSLQKRRDVKITLTTPPWEAATKEKQP